MQQSSWFPGASQLYPEAKLGPRHLALSPSPLPTPREGP